MSNSEIDVYMEWLISKEIQGKFLIKEIVSNCDGLKIFLTPVSETLNLKNLTIFFDSYAVYKEMDESYKAKTWAEKGGFSGSFYLVKSSAWLEWFHSESLGYYQDQKFVHYSIITALNCIDILSEFPPEISVGS